MKNQHIEQVVLGLDDASPFLAEIRRRYFPQKARLTTAERLVYPAIDPAFSFHFARAYHRARKVPPNFIWSSCIWRAYCCLRYDGQLNYVDPVCHAALALGQPGSRIKAMIVKALTCAGLSPGAIGKCMGESPEVIQLFCELFFDFQDRQDNFLFVAKTLNPKGELQPFKANKDQAKDPALLLMNVGYRLGPEAVLKAVGLRVKQNGFRSEFEILKNAKRMLLADMELKASFAMLDGSEPGFGILKAFVSEEARHEPVSVDDDAVMGLTRLSYDQGAMHVFKKLVGDAAYERLENARMFDAQREADVAKAKAVADEGSSE